MRVLSSLFSDKPVVIEMTLASIVSLLVTYTWFYLSHQYFPEVAPSVWEMLGVFFTLACVYLTARQNIWCWPLGIISVVFFGIAFYQYQLYSSAVLNLLYYFPIQFWGWYQWLYGGKNKSELVPTWLNLKQRSFTISGILIGATIWGTLLSTYTDAVYVYADALILGMSIVAQFIMSYKKIEAWMIWIAVDVLSLVLYWNTGLYMIGVLYGGFILIASFGLYEWLRDRRRLLHA